MSETTKIEWADATFNPWIGCTKVLAGCKNCYAENVTRARILRSQGHETWGKGAKRSRTSEATWRNPLKWNREAGRMDAASENTPHVPFKVFPSLCDWLDDEVPIKDFVDFLELIYKTPNLDWLLLTKRPENWWTRIHAALTADDSEWLESWLDCVDMPERGDIPQNIWIGTSCENQEMADNRIPELLKIPAKVRFISAEPLLGPIDLESVKQTVDPGFFGDCLRWHHRGQCHELEGIQYPTVDWVIVGGESGTGARQCSVEWIKTIVQQCKDASTACFVKQLGANPRHDTTGEMVPISGPMTGKANVKINNCPLYLKDKKGGDMSEWPDDLKVRQFPALA